MRLITIAALCLACGIANADSNDVVQVHTMEVKERMQNLELINVTAEKPADDDAQVLEASLQAIIDEADAAENAESDSER
jgi:hypothetical protein